MYTRRVYLGTPLSGLRSASRSLGASFVVLLMLLGGLGLLLLVRRRALVRFVLRLWPYLGVVILLICMPFLVALAFS